MRRRRRDRRGVAAEARDRTLPAKLNLVTVGQFGTLDAGTVDERAVAAVDVLQYVSITVPGDCRVEARNESLVLRRNHDVEGGIASDLRFRFAKGDVSAAPRAGREPQRRRHV